MATETAPSLDDYRWLVGPEAGGLLADLAADEDSLLARAARLRNLLSAPRAHLLLEQVELRRRAKEKFELAGRMFFTARGLEQATDDIVAAYKAARFPQGEPLLDLCCGIGGDLLSLCRRGPVLAVDRDPVTVLLANSNGRAAVQAGSAGTVPCVMALDAGAVDLHDTVAWHIDPDRRPQGRRTTRVELHDPPPEEIDRMRSACPHAAVKLAPAARPPAHWASAAELEWISRGGQCRQLVAWFGDLARESGRRRATVLRDNAEPLRTVVGNDALDAPITTQVQRYLFEPDAAVLAAGLGGALAREHGLAAVAPGIGYFTGERPIEDAALACFEVVETLPFDLKRVRALLAARNVGPLEIKKRGVPHTPEELRRRLRPCGEHPATLFVTRVDRAVTAILARRLPSHGRSSFHSHG